MTDNKKTPILRVSRLKKQFGGLVAIKNVTTEVKRGSLKAIIGPNGAGKTTTLNMISGLLRPDEGEVWLEDHNITHSKPAQIAKLGVARTFQHPCIYHDLTVLENVLIASANNAQQHFLQSFLDNLFILSINEIRKNAEKQALEMLEFVGLAHKSKENAQILTFGEQKILELARALALEPTPKLLMLDEPTAGLNSDEAKTYMKLLLELKKTNVTILMIEHRLDLVESVSDEVLVINFGEVLADDIPNAVWSDQRVIDAYIGSNIEKEREAEIR